MLSKAISFLLPVICFISTATAIPAARPQLPTKRDDQASGYVLYGVVMSTASGPISSTTPPVTSPDASYTTGQDLVKELLSPLVSGGNAVDDAFLSLLRPSTSSIIPQPSYSSLPSSITSSVPTPSGNTFGFPNTSASQSSRRSWNTTTQQLSNSSLPTPTTSVSGSSSTSLGNSTSGNLYSTNSTNSSSGFNSTDSSNPFRGSNSTTTLNTTNSSNTTLSASQEPSVFVAPVQSSNSSSTSITPTSTSASGSGSITPGSAMNTASGTSGVSSSTSTFTAAPASSSDSGTLTNSSIAGIAVGCAAAFALLVTALGYIFRRRYHANLAQKQQTYPKLAYLYDPPGQPPSTHTASTARLRPSGEAGALASGGTGGFDNNRYMGYESPRIPSLPPPTPTMARGGEGTRGLGIEAESSPFVGSNPPPPPGFIHDVEAQQQPLPQEMQQSHPPEPLQRSPEIGSSEISPFIAGVPPKARRSSSPTLAQHSGSSSVKMEQREGTWWF